jgi:hypothetical protein
VAFYNLHLIISNPHEELLKIIVGGSKFTGDFETWKKCYLLEQKYWKDLFATPFDASPSVHLQSQNSPPPGFDVVSESSPIKGTVFGSSWEGNNFGVDEFHESGIVSYRNDVAPRTLKQVRKKHNDVVSFILNLTPKKTQFGLK